MLFLIEMSLFVVMSSKWSHNSAWNCHDLGVLINLTDELNCE